MNTYIARITSLTANLARLQDKSESPKAGNDIVLMLGKGKQGENHATYFSESTNAYINLHCQADLVDGIFAIGINPKVPKRFVQFVNAVSAGDYTKIDRTSAKGIYALMLAGEFSLCRKALAALVSRYQREGVSENTRGISMMTLSKLFKGDVGANTVETQISRTFGENGFAQQAGLTFGNPKTQNREFWVNLDSPLVKRFESLIQKATDKQIESIGSEA